MGGLRPGREDHQLAQRKHAYGIGAARVEGSVQRLGKLADIISETSVQAKLGTALNQYALYFGLALILLVAASRGWNRIAQARLGEGARKRQE